MVFTVSTSESSQSTHITEVAYENRKKGQSLTFVHLNCVDPNMHFLGSQLHGSWERGAGIHCLIHVSSLLHYNFIRTQVHSLIFTVITFLTSSSHNKGFSFKCLYYSSSQSRLVQRFSCPSLICECSVFLVLS